MCYEYVRVSALRWARHEGCAMTVCALPRGQLMCGARMSGRTSDCRRNSVQENCNMGACWRTGF